MPTTLTTVWMLCALRAAPNCALCSMSPSTTVTPLATYWSMTARLAGSASEAGLASRNGLTYTGREEVVYCGSTSASSTAFPIMP